MQQTIRHGLPLLVAAQAQKEVTHNEALLAIDRRLQIAVATIGSNMRPATPVAGDCHIVGPVPTGAWAGQADSIAMHDDFGWQFTPPRTGFMSYVSDAGIPAIYRESWQISAWPVAALRIGGSTVLGASPAAVAPPLGGAVIDSELRAAFGPLLTARVAQGFVT